jgi:hypothetical protein
MSIEDHPEVRVRRYCSPEEVSKIRPYHSPRWWRRQVCAGRLPGTIKPTGQHSHGRTWILLDEAEALLRGEHAAQEES